MQKEQIDRFVTLAGLEMPALISPGKFQEAEIYEDSAVLISTDLYDQKKGLSLQADTGKAEFV